MMLWYLVRLAKEALFFLVLEAGRARSMHPVLPAVLIRASSLPVTIVQVNRSQALRA